MLEHPAGDLVDRVVAADVLHVDQRLVLARQHAAVDRAGLEIERRRGVDLVGQRVEPRGAQLGVRQRDVLQRLHQVAEHGALRAARGLHLLLQLLLVVGLALGAHHHDRRVLVVVDAGDDVVRQQHVLVEQVADREIFRIVADRHRGDDLLAVEEDRQRALDRDRGLDLRAGLVDAGDALGQPRVGRVRAGADSRRDGKPSGEECGLAGVFKGPGAASPFETPAFAARMGLLRVRLRKMGASSPSTFPLMVRSATAGRASQPWAASNPHGRCCRARAQASRIKYMLDEVHNKTRDQLRFDLSENNSCFEERFSIRPITPPWSVILTGTPLKVSVG